MALEMGKPLREGRAEVEKCAWVCRFYAAHGEAFLADETIASDAQRSLIAYQPLGPVLAVMPWNFPFWQVFRFAAPAIMAGNVGLTLSGMSVVDALGTVTNLIPGDVSLPEEMNSFDAIALDGASLGLGFSASPSGLDSIWANVDGAGQCGPGPIGSA